MAKAQDDLKKKFHGFVHDKEATAKMIKEYLQGANPSVKAMMDALKSFGEAQKAGSAAFQERMKETLEILRVELGKDDITEKQRDIIYNLISDVLKMAQQEARENREFYEKLIVATSLLGLTTIVGGAVYLASQNKEAILKGATKVAFEAVESFIRR